MKKTAVSGPKVIYHSDRTGNTITFTQREQLPPFLQQIHAPGTYSVMSACASYLAGDGARLLIGIYRLRIVLVVCSLSFSAEMCRDRCCSQVH